MPDATVTARPAWVDELVTRFGEPTVECLDPIRSADRTRQHWAWRGPGGGVSVVGIDRIVGVDGMDDHYRARVGHPDPARVVDMVTELPPTDDEMRKLCALAWPEAVTDA